jgi:hypothetical protein
MNKNISIDLKSNSYTAIISTLVISTFILIFIFGVIISKGLVLVNGNDHTTREIFSYFALSIIAITIPTILNFAVGKTLIYKDTCLIDPEADKLYINETNTINKASKIKLDLDIKDLNEIIFIRVHEDEDGIVNSYHIYMSSPGLKPVKVYTFQKFHYVVRFITQITDLTSIKCLDWTDQNFEKESDFVDYYLKKQT